MRLRAYGLKIVFRIPGRALGGLAFRVQGLARTSPEDGWSSTRPALAAGFLRSAFEKGRNQKTRNHAKHP